MVNAPGMETLLVPIAYPTGKLETIDVTVWGDECQGVEALGSEGNQWFSTYLKTSGVKFVRMKDTCVRKTDEKYAPDGQTSFADGFAFLLASVESLEFVNSRLAEPLTQERFRPNIIVRGGGAFEEDRWERIRFHDVNSTNSSSSSNTGSSTMEMSVVKPCARCTIPNVDPATGVPHPQREPSRSMQAFRSGAAIHFKNPKWRKEVRLLSVCMRC